MVCDITVVFHSGVWDLMAVNSFKAQVYLPMILSSIRCPMGAQYSNAKIESIILKFACIFSSFLLQAVEKRFLFLNISRCEVFYSFCCFVLELSHSDFHMSFVLIYIFFHFYCTSTFVSELSSKSFLCQSLSQQLCWELGSFCVQFAYLCTVDLLPAQMSSS